MLGPGVPKTGRGELFVPLAMSSAGFGATPQIWGTRGSGEAVNPKKPGTAPEGLGWGGVGFLT